MTCPMKKQQGCGSENRKNFEKLDRNDDETQFCENCGFENYGLRLCNTIKGELN